MKLMKRKSISFLVAIVMTFSVSSCELFDLDINTDPNNPSQVSPELLLSSVMLNASLVFAADLNDATMGFMSVTATNDDFNLTNQTWNTQWNYLYTTPLADLERLIVSLEEAGNNPRYLGIAQILKAYYFSLMVDLWGDIPYSQAFKGDSGIKDAAYDDDQDIYASLLGLLDAGIENLAAQSTVPTTAGDLIYGDAGLDQMDMWKRAAYSIKLRLLITARNNPEINATAEINEIVTAHLADLAADGVGLFVLPGEDFEFQFSRTVSPDNRHPMYFDGYGGGEAAYTYFGHKYMAEMLANRDPRTPFYFKRQTSTVLNADDPTQKQTMPCSQRDDCIFSYFPKSAFVTNMIFQKTPGDLSPDEEAYLAGFFGRDRSDPSGVPNDNPIRTTVGVYPAGGLFDDVAEKVAGEVVGSGDGIFPMVTSWMVKFYLIEAQIELGVNAGETNENLLRAALTEQLDRVFNFSAESDASVEPDETLWGEEYDWPITFETREDFIDGVVSAYGATSNKLNFVMKQAWFANFGNGYEMYNAFRRTHYPNDLQTPLQLPRQFAVRLPYAQSELNLNPNTPSIVYDNPNAAVFWDTDPFQF